MKNSLNSKIAKNQTDEKIGYSHSQRAIDIIGVSYHKVLSFVLKDAMFEIGMRNFYSEV
jgi:hypothetical protein